MDSLLLALLSHLCQETIKRKLDSRSNKHANSDFLQQGLGGGASFPPLPPESLSKLESVDRAF